MKKSKPGPKKKDPKLKVVQINLYVETWKVELLGKDEVRTLSMKAIDKEVNKATKKPKE